MFLEIKSIIISRFSILLVSYLIDQPPPSVHIVHPPHKNLYPPDRTASLRDPDNFHTLQLCRHISAYLDFCIDIS